MSQAGNPITFSPTLFRQYYSQFANSGAFPDAALNSWFWQASQYVSTSDNALYMLTGDPRLYALNLLTAHIGAISILIAAGQTPVIETSAGIDKIRVTVQPPPDKTQFGWWLDTTGYGQMLNALLQSVTAGGTFVGGSPIRAGFRGPGGRFGR